MRFWSQDGPKVRFWTPKLISGVNVAPWLKRLMKQRVSGTFFRTLGAKMRKWAHFAHFGVPKWKMCSFSDFFDSFSPKTLKCPFFHF